MIKGGTEKATKRKGLPFHEAKCHNGFRQDSEQTGGQAEPQSGRPRANHCPGEAGRAGKSTWAGVFTQQPATTGAFTAGRAFDQEEAEQISSAPRAAATRTPRRVVFRHGRLVPARPRRGRPFHVARDKRGERGETSAAADVRAPCARRTYACLSGRSSG